MSSRLFTRLAFVAGAAATLLVMRPALADPGAMSADEYKLYREYQAALEDPRVVKMKASRRLPAIARNFGVNRHKLQRVVTKGEKSAEGLVAENQAAVKAALAKSKVAAKIASVELVDQSGVVIAYVSWTGDKDRLPQEASYVAKAVAEASPLVSIVALWSCMGRTKVFTAKIRTSAAERIKASRIEDFAATRYLRLFEDVHNLFEGQAPADAAGCGG